MSANQDRFYKLGEAQKLLGVVDERFGADRAVWPAKLSASAA